MWGILDPASPAGDPSYTGMCGAVARGEVTTSVAGMAVTAGRAVGLDFPQSAGSAR